MVLHLYGDSDIAYHVSDQYQAYTLFMFNICTSVINYVFKKLISETIQILSKCEKDTHSVMIIDANLESKEFSCEFISGKLDD